MKLFLRQFAAILTAVTAAATPAIRAQELPQLPIDQEVRTGTLPNGLTYYIRHNEYPKGQAEFYIAQKVGSIQEEDDQQGLAHFLEHMCFNGTKNFPDSMIVTWLETKGVKFGRDLNAYTSIDETVYNVSSVPTANVAVQDSVLLILHDWSHDLTLSSEEIDKERAVIHEEWRSRNVGQQRVLTDLAPKLYPTSKYAHRMPIGTMEIVDNFPHDALRDYYHKWYRPDLQAVIVVGDIDVDRIESKINEIFADIELPAQRAERIYYPVPDHQGTIYAIGSDPEISYDVVELMWLSDPLPRHMRNTQASYVHNFLTTMISSMLSNRFQEIMAKPDAPFAAAFADYSGYLLSMATKDAFTVGAVPKGDDINQALMAVYRETLRAQTGGFTESEYQRAKSDYLSSIEKTYNNRESRESRTFVNEYVRNFLDGEPIPGIEVDYMIAQQLASQIPIELVNMTFSQMITPDNRVVLALLNSREDRTEPTEAELEADLQSVDAEDIEAFVDNVKTEPLIPQLPAPGTITATETLGQWDATQWTLSNGIKVIVKQTPFKADEILFLATASGGTQDLVGEYADEICFNGGIETIGYGQYNTTDLRKYVAGKQVSIRMTPDIYTRELSGSTTPKDLLTLMEFIYMNFCGLSIDHEEFESAQKTMSALLQNQEATPNFQFLKAVMANLFKSPIRQNVTPEVINRATADKTLALAKQLYNNAAEFTFVFVGNVNLDTLKPLVEQYIASIPTTTPATAELNFDPDAFISPGEELVENTFVMATPQTFVGIFASTDMPHTSHNAKVASIAGQVLSKRLIKTVREDMGAVYSITVSGSSYRFGPRNFLLQSAFPMKPEMKAEVLDIIRQEFRNAESDITPDELAAIKEYMIKDATESLEKNNAWLTAIAGWLTNGVDTFNDAVDHINNITIDDVQQYMKQINASGNYRTIILDPEQ